MKKNGAIHAQADVTADPIREKAGAIREMFGGIAHRYDLLNHLLSANIDKRWRRVCVKAVAKQVNRKQPQILDVGCGTGDLSIEFARLGPVTGSDFCLPMLKLGAKKTVGMKNGQTVRLLTADALRLPFRDDSFDGVVSAFVLRNLADLSSGLEEMFRVVKPGGVVAALEFAMPSSRWLGFCYRLYFSRILPRLGKIISGSTFAYTYLPESVRGFLSPEELTTRFQKAGLRDAECRRLTGGIVVMIVARK